MTAAADINIIIQQAGNVRETQAPRAQPVNSDQMADVVKKMHEEDRVTIQHAEETESLRLKEKKKREEQEEEQKKEKRKKAAGRDEPETEASETPVDDEDEPGQLLDTVV
ncbi:MAG: hypothetical protein SWH61_16265 [Thermodesulfobacteriota bacterium]|nr:hypothetical protein [Thermodesulfobacteriota bacterium]